MSRKPKDTRKHSKLSASSCERWWNCPGSVNACENLPNPPSEYSAEGTVAHRWAELILTKKRTPVFEVGQIVEQDGFEIELTEEMFDHVTAYVEYVQAVIKEAGPSAIVRYEVKVELEEVGSGMFGTADVAIEVPYVIIHAIDFKYGAGKRVKAWKNKQGMYYVLGVAMKADCPKFKVHIFQPRVEEGVTTYEGDATELKEFENELRERAALALSKDAPLIPGDHCKGSFCPNRVNCRALAELSHDVVAKDFDELPQVQTLTTEQIIKVLKYEDTIKDWMSKVKDFAKDIMIKGIEIPGYKVVKSLGHAKWIDPEAVIAEYSDEFGDAIFKPVEKELLSPAQFEKLVGKKRLGKEFRDDNTVRPDAGEKIVEADEKGESLRHTNAQEDF